MTEKTEVEIQKEIDAVKSMRLAASNMEQAIARTRTLERTLETLLEQMKVFKDFVPESAYRYDGKQSLQGEMENAMHVARKVL
jgi:hypothetical protein